MIFICSPNLMQKLIFSGNHFKANHRKGAVDGIGGTVKHAVYSHVLTK